MGILDQERVDRIKGILKWHPRGMTISDLASAIAMNRNLVAKYLDMLLISGQVEMEVIGAAKVYFLSHRVPISALFEFSSDLVITVDSNGRILQVNELVPGLLDVPRETLVGKSLTDIDHPFIRGLSCCDGQQSGTLDCVVHGTEHNFQMKKIPTAFDDGSSGSTFIIEDITARKKYEEMLKISEAKYRHLVQSSGEAIIGNSVDGNITSWNPAAKRLYGYTEAEILGKSIFLLTDDEERANLQMRLEKVVGGESYHRCEMKMRKKDGSPIDVLVTLSPMLGENGSVAGISSIARDITGEKMEQYLRDHEDQYRTLVEDLNVGIYRSTGDPKGKFVWGNTALLNILGYQSISDLKDANVIDMFSSPEGRRDLLEELRENRFVKNRILHLKKPDNTPFSVSVTALAEFDEKKNIVFINGIVQDITKIAEQFSRS